MKQYPLVTALLFFSIFSCVEEEPNTIEEPTGNYFQDKAVEVVFENDRDNGINVFFMGDAYLREDLDKTDSKYQYDGLKSIEVLFESEPFKTYKEHFNAYIVYAESTIEPAGNTFDVYYPFGSYNTDRLNISNYEAVSDYVTEVTGSPRSAKDLVLMGVNYGSGGSAFLGGNVGVFSTSNSRDLNTNVFQTMVHEVGHAFSGLGDEYVNPNRPNNGCFSDFMDNIDITNDLSKIKWNHFIDLEGYSEVNAFEGGCGSVATGVWRPEEYSIMGGNIGSYFNAPSRESIVKKIIELRGMDYDFETFLELDQSDLPNGLRTSLNLGSKIQIECNGAMPLN